MDNITRKYNSNVEKVNQNENNTRKLIPQDLRNLMYKYICGAKTNTTKRRERDALRRQRSYSSNGQIMAASVN